MASSVVVVGGGLAGLVSASRLAERGIDVTVYEREEEVGGRVRSREVEGFTLDRGFQVLFTAYPTASRELDFDALDLRTFTPGACLARPGERSILSDPVRDPGALVQSALNREVGIKDKLGTLSLRSDLQEKNLSRIFEGEDTSIAAYLTERGFSRKFLSNFVAPFYGGITLDRTLGTSASVFEYTFAMLSAGEIAVPAAGMGAIPDQLASRAREAGATIELDREVTSVDPDGPSVTVGTGTVEADAVVVATSPKAARDLTGVAAIPTEGRACVTQWYKLPGEVPLDAGKRLILNCENDRPNQVVPHSTVAPEYSVPGMTLLSATFLGDQSRSDVELAAETREALSSWYPERSFTTLSILATDRIGFAQFAQPPGFYDTLPDVRSPEGRVYLAGDYTQWSSIEGAMESGVLAARAVRDDLPAEPSPEATPETA